MKDWLIEIRWEFHKLVSDERQIYSREPRKTIRLVRAATYDEAVTKLHSAMADSMSSDATFTNLTID